MLLLLILVYVVGTLPGVGAPRQRPGHSASPQARRRSPAEEHRGGDRRLRGPRTAPYSSSLAPALAAPFSPAGACFSAISRRMRFSASRSLVDMTACMPSDELGVQQPRIRQACGSGRAVQAHALALEPVLVVGDGGGVAAEPLPRNFSRAAQHLAPGLGLARSPETLRDPNPLQKVARQALRGEAEARLQRVDACVLQLLTNALGSPVRV